MRRTSNLVLVTAAISFALLNMSAGVILNLAFGSLAIAFSGWLMNRHRVFRAA